ncbi:MAG: GrpB family protein [Mariniphaga sp.]|nr:GrpB family protein [Mariniphaga sp.]
MPHVRYRGNWDEIRFRDYLIQHNDEAAAFEALKLQLAEKYKNDRVTIFTLQTPVKFTGFDIFVASIRNQHQNL